MPEYQCNQSVAEKTLLSIKMCVTKSTSLLLQSPTFLSPVLTSDIHLVAPTSMQQGIWKGQKGPHVKVQASFHQRLAIKE